MTLWGKTSEGRGPFIFSGGLRGAQGRVQKISKVMGIFPREFCVCARAGSERFLIIFSCNDVIINLLGQFWGTLEQGTVFGVHPGCY